MADKPPPYNPNSYQSPYPPPPPPYQAQNQQSNIGFTNPGAPTATVVSGVKLPGRSTTIVTGPSYGSVPNAPIVIQPVADVIVVGGCPACRVGVLDEEFTLGGLCCAFWFFPLGILCCLAMRERRCTNCRAIFPA